MSSGGVYARDTKVSSDKSKAEIERTLARYGAAAFSYATDGNQAVIQFAANNRYVKFVLPLPGRDEFTTYKRGYQTYERTRSEAERRYEQAIRQRWRALALAIKAKLEVVDSGIATFEQEFAVHMVLPNRQTVGEWLLPQIEESYESGQMPKTILALPPGPSTDDDD